MLRTILLETILNENIFIECCSQYYNIKHKLKNSKSKTNVHAIRPKYNCTNSTVKMISRNELFVFWGVHLDELAQIYTPLFVK